MKKRALMNWGQTSLQVTSFESVVEQAGGLAEDLHHFRPKHPLVLIWYSGSEEANRQAYRAAQAVYGLPGASVEEQEAPEGLLHFWTRVRDSLDKDLSLAQQEAAHNLLATA